MGRTLYYGDNLEVMRQLPSEHVDLIYLDPPFNSNADYNVIFREQTGSGSGAQITAFEDTWQWGPESARVLDDLVAIHGGLAKFVDETVLRLGHNALSAYLVMMAPRLVEMHRLLKPSGSLYLHCDPTASHYLKVMMDAVFDPRNFRNEVIWQRTNVHSDSKTWSRVSDTIFFYTKSDQFTWNPPYVPHSDEYIRSKYGSKDPHGRRYTLDNMTSPSPRPNMMYEWMGHSSPPNGWRYSRETMQRLHDQGRIWYPTDKSKRPRLKRFLDEMPGRLLGNVWTDIPPINSQAQERMGYPTQKPLALLERILLASTNIGDVVLDPFCGCGTAVVAAEKLERRWLGIDVTHLAISLVQARLKRDFGLESGRDYELEGTPKDVEAARFLFNQEPDGPYQFQFWAIGLLGAQSHGGGASGKGKKGGDTGIDGKLFFRTPGGERVKPRMVWTFLPV